MKTTPVQRFLYADDFRGFKDTLIPLRAANFLVGENSTGKSSTLELLRVLLSENLWWSQSIFSAAGASFSHFSDIASANSGAETFTIGHISGSSEHRSGYIFLEFEKGARGLPTLTRTLVSAQNRAVALRVGRKQIKYWSVSATRYASLQPGLRAVQVWKQFQKEDRLLSNNSVGTIDIDSDNRPQSLFDHFYAMDMDLASRSESKRRRSAPFFSWGRTLDDQLTWIAPIRSKPRRTYDEHVADYSPEGAHIPTLIRDLLDSQNAGFFKARIAQIGASSGLFESLHIKKYGPQEDAPYELDIVLGKAQLSLSAVGYGVSQALPILIELIAGKGSLYAIQQPEVHLHPRAQAALGDLLFEAASNQSKHLIVETHSDFLIDRFRVNFRKSTKPPSAQVLFFERSEEGNKVSPIEIRTDGSVSDDQPLAYREFFLREEMSILGLG